MSEFFCLDCHHTGPLDVHGRCPRCQSDSVAIAQALRPLDKPLDWISRAIEEAAREKG